jgi:hypothetical protein
MVLGDVSRTRRLAGNPLVANVSDADITQALTFGTSRVKAETGKTDWETDTANAEYASAVTAAEYFADVVIRDRFGDKDDVSTEHWDRAMAIVGQIATNIEGGGTGTGGEGTVSAQYKTFPKNAAITPYHSMFPTSTYLGEDVEGARA